jgi:heme exporter protein D
MTAWLAMEGHGVYVWSAYGLSLLALIVVGAWPLVAMRALVRRLRRRARIADRESPPGDES